MVTVQRRQTGDQSIAEENVAATVAGIDVGLKRKSSRGEYKKSPTPTWIYPVLAGFAALSIVTVPHPFQPHGHPTLNHVFYYGWLTALSTGLGALPFLFLPDIATFWVGISNAIAAGMMVAASYSLLVEGCTYSDPQDHSTISCELRTALGALLGLGFILATKNFLDRYEDLKVGGLGGTGTDARKALLIFFVMTLHSFSEGVGIGVSFGGVHGSELGVFISASLAVHNVPEGLAIAVVLLPRGASVLTAAVWAISTSLPQPLMAVPAYLFVHHFIPILPVGLGFAGGAMAWVAFFELLSEAVEDTNLLTTIVVSLCSLVTMLFAQHMIEEGSRS